jgi:hypothetical protein
MCVQSQVLPLPACLSENPTRLMTLWYMLRNYASIYQTAASLERLRDIGHLYRDSPREVAFPHKEELSKLLTDIHRECFDHGLIYTAEMAERGLKKPSPERYTDLFSTLNHLDESLISELKKESVFHIPSERKSYFEQDELFGTKVAAAFPFCARDIQKAGDCYALGQEDGCVHHLMLVLERGLNALAIKLGVPYQRTNWQQVIDGIGAKLKSSPPDPQRSFFVEVNAQFGFLKDAYRNHSEHARDDPYDMEKALSILNHVRAFMQELAKGGLKE